ncbi:MAG: phage Gp37/Gp68 family protein [Acidobacteria bacterium]|nr:phage Gp37/Gp68 family protein [Acidobacteriota bacterium]MBU4306604.1 phage Gp37/Gp68 family protein [Acidobacteriota bacterium]MCG2812582.1 phage Gp37/Gp68 family protein [Candidatus Aminicenantes bacterium]
MALNTSIEWTESTWNPVTGCSKISAGCKNCYAERMAKRLKAMGQKNYAKGFSLSLHQNVLTNPVKWKKPQRIFVNSMSDLFHEQVPFSFVQDVFDIMNQANWHCFQVLTKRAERLNKVANLLDWGNNIWAGVTVESNEYIYRIDLLRSLPAKIKFISFEPLIGPIGNVDLQGIDWVIVGGESGPYARAIDEEWVIEIRDQCLKMDIPFFFKQWGGWNKKKNGSLLQGINWKQMPNMHLQ